MYNIEKRNMMTEWNINLNGTQISANLKRVSESNLIEKVNISLVGILKWSHVSQELIYTLFIFICIY